MQFRRRPDVVETAAAALRGKGFVNRHPVDFAEHPEVVNPGRGGDQPGDVMSGIAESRYQIHNPRCAGGGVGDFRLERTLQPLDRRDFLGVLHREAG